MTGEEMINRIMKTRKVPELSANLEKAKLLIVIYDTLSKVHLLEILRHNHKVLRQYKKGKPRDYRLFPPGSILKHKTAGYIVHVHKETNGMFFLTTNCLGVRGARTDNRFKDYELIL